MPPLPGADVPQQQKLFDDAKRCHTSTMFYTCKPYECCIYPKAVLSEEKRVICEQECPFDRHCRAECINREYKFFDENNKIVAKSFVEVFLSGVNTSDPHKDQWKTIVPQSVKSCKQLGREVLLEGPFKVLKSFFFLIKTKRMI
jgi:hypothetical protein